MFGGLEPSTKRKVQRAAHDSTVEITPRYRIKLLHPIPYEKHVFLRRLFNHLVVGRKFRALTPKRSDPT